MLKKSPGETILEVLVAVSIMSIVMTGAFVLFQQAIEVNVNIRNRVIALSIAQEGIEAVRSLRDVNWMRFSGDRREKWLCINADCTVSSTPAHPDKIQDGLYRVYYKDGQYVLELASGTDNKAFGKAKTTPGGIVFEPFDSTLASPPPPFLESDLPNDFFELKRDYIEPDNIGYRYTHDSADADASSLFSRQLYLDVQNPFGVGPPGFCPTTGTNDKCGSGTLKIYSIVLWKEQDKYYTVQVETYLMDYFQRKKYDKEER